MKVIQAWLIYDEKSAANNTSYIDWFIDEAQKKGIMMELVIRNELMSGIKNNQSILIRDGREVPSPEVAVVRTIDPLLSSHLEELGTLVFNSSRVAKICNHKALTYKEVQKLSLPMVDTFFYQRHTLPEQPPLDFPFVMKSVHGRGGNEVFLIEDEKTWSRIKDTFPSDEMVVQTANVQPGKDVRVFVVGNEIIAAVRRESRKDFRANFSLGGSAKLYPLSEKETEMVQRICRHFKFDMVGVDFLIDLDGNLLFNEIEDIVGSRTLSKLTDINLLDLYTSHILNKWQQSQKTKNS